MSIIWAAFANSYYMSIFPVFKSSSLNFFLYWFVFLTVSIIWDIKTLIHYWKNTRNTTFFLGILLLLSFLSKEAQAILLGQKIHMGKQELTEYAKMVVFGSKKCHGLHFWWYNYIQQEHDKVLILLDKESYANHINWCHCTTMDVYITSQPTPLLKLNSTLSYWNVFLA